MRVALVAVLLLVAGCAPAAAGRAAAPSPGQSRTGQPSPGQPLSLASPAAPAAPGPSLAVRRTTADGRPWVLVLPSGPARGAVLVLHGEDETTAVARRTYGLAQLGVQGQAVAYLGGKGGSWNSGGCCGYALRTRLDDESYLRAVRDQVGALLPPGAPVSVLGYSSGAMLAWSAVCRQDLHLRAVLSAGGTLTSSCPARSLPQVFEELHGTRDATVRLSGPSAVVPVLGQAVPPVRPALARLVQGCRTLSATDWDCAGRSVRLLLRPGAGHRYDGLGVAAALRELLRSVGQLP